MKTILVPTEQSPTMVSALDTALLLARKFDGCIEGFPLRPAVADLVAMDPDSGLTMVAVKENDALVLVVLAGGEDVIVVSGGGAVAVEIVHVRVAGVGSTFPATSTARTSNVCVPTASPE